MSAVAIDAITFDVHARRDPGDVADLMVSMAEVGLLHPVVVTSERRLVAGGRRLAAAKALGWTEIDVTVATSLTTAESQLRAELEENTCRRELTPVEAAEARERLASVLAPLAEVRVGGRGRRVETSSKLDEVSPTARATRKVAAIGTGYSGSSLDKVDHVRRIAADPAQSEPVRRVAEVALSRLAASPQTAIEPNYQAVVEAQQAAVVEQVAAVLPPDDQSALDLKYRRASMRASIKAGELLTFDAARIGRISPGGEIDSYVALARSIDDFVTRMTAAQRSGLRLVESAR